MGIKAALIRPLAWWTARRIAHWSAHAVEAQQRQFRQLIDKASHTAFGRDHHFRDMHTYDDFKARVPLRDYEQIRPYIDRIKAGEQDVLWPGRPRYFAKTSGTTSGTKYIPLTTESLPNHFGTARNALFNHIALSGRASWLDGQMIFLSGSPVLEDVGGIPTGRLSGIVNHLVPAWLRTNQKPSWAVNCVEDWEEKLEGITTETIRADMRLISGIPPWVQMYYERLLQRSGKASVRELFPNLSMFVYGGVNFEPYRAQLEKLVGGPIDSVETYPASEGFIAFQDRPGQRGLLLNVDAGIFFEFVPLAEISASQPTRYSLDQVEIGVQYAIIINSNAGLWGYNIGDTVEFISTSPPRILVTGRVKHFISAFGEHVIGKEVEEAMNRSAAQHLCGIVEFTVAPQVSPPEGGLPYHEWFVEFDIPPAQPEAFAATLDQEMRRQNIYYNDLISGNILRPCVVRYLKKDSFRQYMKSMGKLGGQNKVPRLSDNRSLAEHLEAYRR
jgi:hypothetical protein